jgi:hypothetical protein
VLFRSKEDDLTLAWPAFQQSCKGLKNNPAWNGVCQAAAGLPALPEGPAIRAFF